MHKSMCISEKHFHFDCRATSQAGRYPAAGFHPPLWAEGSFLQPDQEICVSVLPQTQSRYKVSAGVHFCNPRCRGAVKCSLSLALPHFTVIQFSISAGSRQVVLCIVEPCRKAWRKAVPFSASLHTPSLFLTPTSALLYTPPPLTKTRSL